MEVRLRDKAICWVAIALFSFFAVVSLLAMRPTESGLSGFSVVGFLPLLTWFVLGCIARNKQIWSFFFASFSLYILIFVCNGIEDFYVRLPFMAYVAYLFSEIYFLFPVIYFIVFFRRAAAIFACTHSPQAKEKREREQEEIWKREMKKAAGGSAQKRPPHRPKTEGRGKNEAQAEQNRIDGGSAPRIPDPPKDSAVSQKINVNTCTADELLALPGISPVEAQQAIASRSEQGPYTSPEDFIRRNPTKPHFAVQILKMIETPATAEPEKKTPPKRRTLDL